MAKTSWPRVNEDTTDTQYAELFDSIIGSGVRDANALAVSADSTGLNVKVASGFAVVGGNAFLSTAQETLAITANTGTLARVDLIVLRRNFSQAAGKTVDLLVKTGSSTPTVDIKGTYELVLATVTVPPNAATLTSANVTDSRTFLTERVGTWTTSQRPAHRKGRLGLNLSTGKWEWSDGATWAALYTWANLPDKPAAIPVAEGGTGATSATSARTNLGAAAAAHQHDIRDVLQDGKPIMDNYLPNAYATKGHGHKLTDSGISGTLPVSKGGTGATSAVAALQALGIYVQASAPAHSNGRVWIKRP